MIYLIQVEKIVSIKITINMHQS